MINKQYIYKLTSNKKRVYKIKSLNEKENHRIKDLLDIVGIIEILETYCVGSENVINVEYRLRRNRSFISRQSDAYNPIICSPKIVCFK